MRISLVGILGLALAGCVDLGSSSSRVEGEGGAGADGEVDHDSCKIEGEQIGEDGAVLRLGATTVTFHDWVDKTGSQGEYVGFSITVTGASSVGYVVKSGGELSHSTASSWLHAAGPDGGSQAPGISNVDFCEECEDGSCDDDGGDGGGGGGDGDGGDGCIEGCGSGSGSGSDGDLT